MSAPLPTADEYWCALTDAAGVNRSSASVMGSVMHRAIIRQFDGMAGSGVLESLVGSSALVYVGLRGRMQSGDERPEWFDLEISPAFGTWRARYERTPPDENYGTAGMAIDSEQAPGPMPRVHVEHPSTLVHLEKLPIWGGIRHRPGDFLPGSVEVQWQESAPIPSNEPNWDSSSRPSGPQQPSGKSSSEPLTWSCSPVPGELARIELKCPDNPQSDGTVIFELLHRVCLFHELRYRGEPHTTIIVDAARFTPDAPWRQFTRIEP